MGVYAKDRSVAFVHIPKCAGWSVKKWMVDNLESRIVAPDDPMYQQEEFSGSVEVDDKMPGGHIRLADWERYTGVDPASYDVIVAVVREPYQHVLSQYLFLRHLWGRGLRMAQHRVAIQHPTFAEWLENPRSEYHARYNYHDHRPPKYLGDDAPGYADHGGYYMYWLGVDGRIPDNVETVRINQLDEQLPALLAEHVTGEPTTVPRLNEVHGTYQLGMHYTDAAKLRVERMYRYAFDRWYEKRDFPTRGAEAQRKRYQNINVSDMPEDPAHLAERLDLIGDHSPESRRRVGVWRWPGV